MNPKTLLILSVSGIVASLAIPVLFVIAGVDPTSWRGIAVQVVSVVVAGASVAGVIEARGRMSRS